MLHYFSVTNKMQSVYLKSRCSQHHQHAVFGRGTHSLFKNWRFSCDSSSTRPPLIFRDIEITATVLLIQIKYFFTLKFFWRSTTDFRKLLFLFWMLFSEHHMQNPKLQGTPYYRVKTFFRYQRRHYEKVCGSSNIAKVSGLLRYGDGWQAPRQSAFQLVLFKSYYNCNF